MSFPKPPAKIVPFNSGVVAAHDIGRQFDEHARALLNVINFLRTIIRDDGAVIAPVVSQPALVPRSSVQPDLPVGVLGPNAGGKHGTDTLSSAATAQDYAQVCIDWAEHMPDTIPLQTLAINAITGDHWSARWWANRAAQIVSSGTLLAPMFAEKLNIPAPNTCSNLSFTPAGPVLLILNGVSLLPVGAPAPFSVSGNTITWLSTIYSLIPGQSDLSAWYPFSP